MATKANRPTAKDIKVGKTLWQVYVDVHDVIEGQVTDIMMRRLFIKRRMTSGTYRGMYEVHYQAMDSRHEEKHGRISYYHLAELDATSSLSLSSYMFGKKAAALGFMISALQLEDTFKVSTPDCYNKIVAKLQSRLPAPVYDPEIPLETEEDADAVLSAFGIEIALDLTVGQRSVDTMPYSGGLSVSADQMQTHHQLSKTESKDYKLDEILADKKLDPEDYPIDHGRDESAWKV